MRQKRIKIFSLVLALVAILILGMGVYFVVHTKKIQTSTTTKTPMISQLTLSSTPTKTVTSQFYYPISNYSQRKTLKWFGKDVTAADTKAEMCGANFTGYHVGDDLEILPGELNADVPVYSIADGVVREAQYVSGYGGLIVIQSEINNQTVTAYYGHINLASLQVKVGDKITAGQRLANLGAACSSQTDGERKHLHFAIHKSSAIDARGYVQNQAELSAWLDPSQFLVQLQAQLPAS